LIKGGDEMTNFLKGFLTGYIIGSAVVVCGILLYTTIF